MSAAEPSVSIDDVVQILRVNRNAILIIDSDRAQKDKQINATKQRLVREIEALDGIAWVTSGREIENYIPDAAVRQLYKDADVSNRTPYSDFADILDGIQNDEGKRFTRNKVLFAEKVLSHLKLEDLQTMLDWKDKASEVFVRIQSWNGLVQALEPHSGR